MKIAAVVFNSVQHDARVIKEAESLRQAGHDVVIFGVQDNLLTARQMQTPNGVAIRLVRWRPLYLQRLLRVNRALLPLLLAVALLVGGLAALAVFLVLQGWRWSPLHTAAMIAGGAVLVFMLRRWLMQEQWIRNQLRLQSIQAPVPGKYSLKMRILSWVAQAMLPLLASPWQLKTQAERAVDVGLRVGAMRHILLQELLAFGPEVVHCHDVGTLPLGLVCKERLGSKIVYDSHELHAETAGQSLYGKLAAIWREHKAAAEIDACITVNPFIARALQERYPRMPEPLVVCNASRPLEKGAYDDGRLHAAAGLEPHVRILLYQGGFALHRGLLQLVQCAPFLPAGWALVFMGWGRLEERLRLEAQRVDQRQERIRFVPAAPQSELPWWTAGASLGVIPYENVSLNHWFCSPNKLWEYPQAGVPILASPFPFMRSLVEGRGLGWLLDPGLDPDAIAGQVAALTDQDLAQARQRCLEFISQDNWDFYATRLVELYRRFDPA